MLAQVLEQLGRARARQASRLAAVAVELQVGEVRLAAREGAHRVERGVGVAGDAEVVGVDVDGVRQPELVDGAADRLEDLARRHLEAGDGVVERLDVPVALLPQLDAAGVDELDPVAAGRLEPPGDGVAQLRRDAPPDSRISSNSTWLLPIRIRNALSIIGVSRSSESTWRAASGGAAASTTVV